MQPQPCDLTVTRATVLPFDASWSTLFDCDIVVRNGRIAALGEAAAVGVDPQAKLDGRNLLITPGLFYARAGVPIHFQGMAGLGETSLALAIAHRLRRPVSVMAGNDWLDIDDMSGNEVGQTTHSVVAKYIQRVRRSR